MKKSIKNQDGFGVVEVILVIVVLGLIGFIAYYAYSQRHKAAASTASTQATADSYAGWKTYCDKSTNGCFMYLPDWEDLITGTGITALGGNKGETLKLDYDEPTDASGGLGDFLTKSLDTITVSGSTYDIVGGYYTVSNVPSYYLVDPSLAQQLGLKVGVTSKITNNDLYFTLASKKAAFVVHYNTAASGGTSSIPAATANAWFTSKDGQTALKTVQSFSKQ